MRVYLGIDWSERKHAAVFMNEAGVEQMRLIFDHSADGFAKLDQARQKLGVAAEDCWVALETAHNLIIDFLWARGYGHVFVTPPHLIDANRGRLTSSGAHDDPRDAWLICDTLRTDQARLRPWQPEGLLLRQMRALVSELIFLTHQNVRLANRLRSLLLRYYPAALEVFKSPVVPIRLHFIIAYPTPQAAAALSQADFVAFCRSHGYTRLSLLGGCYARLTAQQPEAAPETVACYQHEAVLLAQLLLATITAKQQALARLQPIFHRHPDAPLFASLPGAADFLAPALLAKFGEDRQRFPDAAGLQALAGTCPVTEASGKVRHVHLRYACDREFRYIVTTWARASLRVSPFAQAYVQRVRPTCASESQVYRCLANRWLAVAWKLWQSRKPYDETYHLQQRALRSQPKPTAQPK